MALLVIDTNTGRPRCPGCGACYEFTHWLLDSRQRRCYDGTGVSAAPAVAAFQAAHAPCPEPEVTRTRRGVLVTERRRR